MVRSVTGYSAPQIPLLALQRRGERLLSYETTVVGAFSQATELKLTAAALLHYDQDTIVATA